MSLLKSTTLLSLSILVFIIGQVTCCSKTHHFIPIAVEVDGSECDGLTFVTRSEWGGRQPKDSPSKLTKPVAMTFIHHTATPGCEDLSGCAKRVRSIQNYHMDNNGWSDIGYSFLIGGDGRVYVGCGWDDVGAHTSGYNSVALGLSLIGNFMNSPPTQAAISATQKVLECGMKKGFIVGKYELFGHRDGGSTDCPGNALYNLIRYWPTYSSRKIKKF